VNLERFATVRDKGQDIDVNKISIFTDEIRIGDEKVLIIDRGANCIYI
jgi:hypothetical protein